LALIAGLTGQVCAYTPEQQTLLEGMKLSSQLWMAHENAIRGQNVTEYNNLVDIYNVWIRQHFGEGADALLMSKITTTNLPGIAQKQQSTTENPYYRTESPPGTINPYATRNPFNTSSNLSKFGKQQVRTDLMGEAGYIEATTADRVLKDFLAT
jgi:hypothetical protein